MRTLDIIAVVLILLGGLNWGLVGLMDFNLVAAIFGGLDAVITRLIYLLVGVSAVYSFIRVLNWKAIKSNYCVGFEKPVEKGA